MDRLSSVVSEVWIAFERLSFVIVLRDFEGGMSGGG